MLNVLKQRIAGNLFNIRGWKTREKIVVIESDDWGSIRMPSKEVFNRLLSAGIDVDKCNYCKYDSLETEDDLTSLFEVLSSCSASSGNKPVFTANTIVANPDFEKIEQTDFKEYHYELSSKTFERYQGSKNSLNIIKNGLAEKIFHPQLHGREHLNINRWMKYLNDNSKETRLAFENRMFGISTNISKEKRRSYMAALDFDSPDEISFQQEVLKDGQDIFYNLYGYKSQSFIAPNYTWSSKIEPALNAIGIKYIQGSRVQKNPGVENEPFKRHSVGEKNTSNQFFLVRNAFFEPSLMSSTYDSVGACLKEIETSFRWKKPAIIGTHRLNYTGTIVEKNRTENLKKLSSLLSSIIKRWPEVKFISSDKLGQLIENG